MVLIIATLLTALAATQARLVHDEQAPSAASPAQIKFAIENKYDQTGPGAKEPEYAHKTFKTIEDALLGYINDPDTKLPGKEREKAYEKLLGNSDADQYHKIRKQPILVTRYSFPNKKVFYHEPHTQMGILDLRGMEAPRSYVREPFKTKKVQYVKLHPASLPRYRTAPEEYEEEYNPNPEYTYSYGVHDRHTGDSKSAHETREGGVVKGYYTVVDADGKQRTVHYTADDKQGFRATVQRTPTNSHGQ